MKFLHLRWQWLGLLALVAVPAGNVRAANTLPSLYVEGLTIAGQTESEVTGSFTVSNADESAYGNLRYEIQLISPEPEKPPGQIVADNYTVYDMQAASEVLSVAGKGTKQVSFTYPLPKIPAGTYRLRIQLKTENDRGLGWEDVTLTTAGEATGFVTLNPSQILVTSIDPVTKVTRSTWAPLEGPSVAPGGSLSLEVSAGVTGTTSVTGTWHVETKRLLSAAAKPSSTTVGEVTTLQPGEPTLVPVPITAQAEPGAYRAVVSFQDAAGVRQSGLAEFRYVVQGASASLLPHSIPEPHFGRGETMGVLFGVAGPADRSSTFSGTVEVALFDGDTALGSTQETIEVSQFNTLSGEATIELAAPVCNQLRSVVTLRDSNGTTVDQAEQTYSDLAIPACGSLTKFGWGKIGVFGIGAVAALAAVYALVKTWQRRNAPTIGTPMMWLLPAVAVAASLAVGAPAWASGIQFTQGPVSGLSVSISKPIHNGDLQSTSPIDYEVQVQWSGCECTSGLDQIFIYSYTLGGKLEAPDDPQSFVVNDTWRPEASEVISGARDYTANLYLPFPYDYPPTHSTTLLTKVTSAAAQDSEPGALYDFTWLNFPAPGTEPGSPQAKIDLTPFNGCLNSKIEADGSNSFDPGGDSPKGVIQTYDWQVFDDLLDPFPFIKTEPILGAGIDNCQPTPGEPLEDTKMYIEWGDAPLDKCPGPFGTKREGKGDVRSKAYLGGKGGETKGHLKEFDVIKDGKFIVDGDIDGDGLPDSQFDPDVEGIAVQRGRGFVEFTLYGGWPKGGDDFEMAYGKLVVEGREIDDVITRGIEGQGDGLCGRQYPAGERDEVYWEDGKQHLRFFLHVDSSQDRFKVVFKPGGGACPKPFGSSIEFKATEFGTYPIELTVDDYDGNQSVTTKTSATVYNQLPVAAIAPVEDIVARVPVPLDGSGSGDPDVNRCGDTIEYQWTVTGPDGAVSVDDPTAKITAFTPQVSGPHTATLTVTDNHDGEKTITRVLGVKLRPLDPREIQEVE